MDRGRQLLKKSKRMMKVFNREISNLEFEIST